MGAFKIGAKRFRQLRWTNVIDSSSDNALACKIKFIAALMLALEIELDETTENFSELRRESFVV